MSLKVLLADAGDILKSVLELSEEDQDIEVVHVTSGMDALLRIKEIKPDVLIADVSVPGVDGYSLCEIAGREADLAGMRSVLTSEEDAEVDNSRVESSASDGYLPKPFNAEKLLIHLGMKEAEPEDADVEAEAQDEGAFQMDVSDDMSFADVALSEERDAAEDEFSVEESPAVGEEEEDVDSDEEEKKPESLDSILGLDDDEREEVVDVDLGGEEQEEAVPLQMSEPVAEPAGPFDTTEAEEIEEKDELFGEEVSQPDMSGAVAGDLASEEGQRLIEEIVKQLSDKVVREVAWEVVPDLAERIIKETLEKITK